MNEVQRDDERLISPEVYDIGMFRARQEEPVRAAFNITDDVHPLDTVTPPTRPEVEQQMVADLHKVAIDIQDLINRRHIKDTGYRYDETA